MNAAGVPTPFMGSGIKQDLHLLFSKFSAIESDKIRDFGDVFRETHFETIFHYRLNPVESLEFSEYLLQNAALYFDKYNEIGESRSLKERLFGIYVCYALYNLQPIDHVSQIPVTLAQFEELLSFQKILASEKFIEPLAALKNLLLKKAFRLKLFQSTYDPVTHKKYLSEEELPNYSRKPIEPFSRIKQIQNHHLFGELKCIHQEYTKFKKMLGVNDVQLVEKLNPTEEVQKVLEHHKKELDSIKIKEDESNEKQAESAGTSRSALRSKAYSAGLKHTRQRRHLDPNMEENFKHLTFGQIAQKCLEEASSQTGPTERHLKRIRRRRTFDSEPLEQYDGHAMAEQVLREEYAARVKPEQEEEDHKFGLKIGKLGTSGVAKIRAPKRTNVKLVQVKAEPVDNDNPPITSSQIDASFNSPEKKRRALQQDVKPKISNEWANKLHAWTGQVEATDKQLKKLRNQIKLEVMDEDE